MAGNYYINVSIYFILKCYNTPHPHPHFCVSILDVKVIGSRNYSECYFGSCQRRTSRDSDCVSRFTCVVYCGESYKYASIPTVRVEGSFTITVTEVYGNNHAFLRRLAKEWYKQDTKFKQNVTLYYVIDQHSNGVQKQNKINHAILRKLFIKIGLSELK